MSETFLNAGETALEQNRQKSLLSQTLHSNIGNAHLQRSKSPKQQSANISNRPSLFWDAYTGLPQPDDMESFINVIPLVQSACPSCIVVTVRDYAWLCVTMCDSMTTQTAHKKKIHLLVSVTAIPHWMLRQASCFINTNLLSFLNPSLGKDSTRQSN